MAFYAFSLAAPRRWMAPLALIVIGLWAVVSCGSSSSDNESDDDEGAGSGGDSGRGGTNARGGSGASSGQGGSGGEPDPGGGAGAGGVPPDDCGEEGALRCAGNTRERCEANGSWEPLPSDEQCAGTTPVCNGGVCAGLRLVDGTIDALGPYPVPASQATYVLSRQSLLGMPRVCGSSYCVTGSIRP